MLRAILNRSWRQHPTRYQLYGHLPPITKTIQAKRTRHAEHCWRSKDELISDVLLWIPAYGQAKAGRPARTYIQQLCGDTGSSPEDLPEAMSEREKWRERVRDIRATSTTWWWWWWWSVIRPGKWDAQTFLGFWDTNRSSNLGRMTKPSDSQQKKKRTYRIVDIAVPTDHRVKLKESEKRNQHLHLAWELKKLWNTKVTAVPFVIGPLGAVNKGLVQWLEESEIRGIMETIQTTALLRSAIIQRWVLETRGDLMSLRLQWKPFSFRWCEKLSNE